MNFDEDALEAVKIIEDNKKWVDITDFGDNGTNFLERYFNKMAIYFPPGLNRDKWLLEYKKPVVDEAKVADAWYARRKKMWSRFADVEHPVCAKNNAEMIWTEMREMDFGWELVPGQPCELCTKPLHFDYYGCGCDAEIREDADYDEYMKDVDRIIQCKAICEDCWELVAADMAA